MNEEEKKAFEELSKKAVLCNYEERDYPNMICFKKDMLIVLNLIEKLQKENEELKNEVMEKDLEIIGKEEYTKSSMEEIIKQYYTANEDCIPAQKVKDKIRHYQELQDNYIKKYNEINEGLQAMINVLQELIEEREKK